MNAVIFVYTIVLTLVCFAAAMLSVAAYASAHNLSKREREVLAMVIEGMDNRSIAQELFLSEGTIKTHVHNIMRKTDTRTRDELKKDFWAS